MARKNGKTNASVIIDEIGRTNDVAELCEVTAGAVSQWRVNGIPKHQLKFLKVVRPEVFKKFGIT